MINKLPKSKLLIVASFIVTFVVLSFLVVTIKQYNDFKPYKKLAVDLNDQLGGGFKTTYNWRCGLETTNCPSVRMIKDANFKDNDEAKVLFEGYKKNMTQAGFVEPGFGICREDNNFKVYCTLEAKKNGRTITINAKQDFIGIDIQP